MNVQHKSIFLADGRVLTAHQIVDVQLDIQAGIVTVIMGSWETAEHIDVLSIPPYSQTLQFIYPNWQPEYLQSIEDMVWEHPEWTRTDTPKPSQKHCWQPLIKQWQLLPSESLEEAKAAAWTRIKGARSIAEKGSFICNGKEYQTDLLRIPGASLLAFMAMSLGTPYSEEWTLADNTKQVLDAAGMLAVGKAQGLYISKVFETARQLREQVEAAASIDELDAIQWPT